MSDDNKVICPACAHEFVAIPVNVQERLATLERERDEAIKTLDEEQRIAVLHCKQADEARAERDALAAALRKCERIIVRYANETPLGHQPHMIAHEANAAVVAARAALAKLRGEG